MPKRKSLETISPSFVDTRSDTTRRGYHEGRIPFGAGYGPAGDGVIMPLIVATNDKNPRSPFYGNVGVGRIGNPPLIDDNAYADKDLFTQIVAAPVEIPVELLKEQARKTNKIMLNKDVYKRK